MLTLYLGNKNILQLPLHHQVHKQFYFPNKRDIMKQLSIFFPHEIKSSLTFLQILPYVQPPWQCTNLHQIQEQRKTDVFCFQTTRFVYYGMS